MKYCTATCSGKGFFTHADREAAHLSGHPGNIWCVGDNNATWVERAGGVEKTLEEAQAILDDVIDDAQAKWDLKDEFFKLINPRPVNYSLPT